MNISPLRASPSHVFSPGDRIGRYRIDAILGEGGMGLVLLAHQIDLDMPVAIKTIRPELAADERLVERLFEEARAVASIRSDNVVRVYDVARLYDGTPYLVFELVEGPDIDRVLAQFGPMSLSDAIAVILDVCQGLAEAHRKGIVHRDIKPENLLVEPLSDGTSRVKVSDFGIAKRSMSRKEMSLTQRTGSVGSPWYMAPEQMVSSHDVDPRADVWSTGVVLFEMLTGAVPFPGDSPGEVCARVLSAPPIAIRSLRPELPEAVERVISRCLQKERGRRFTDVGELALALADLAPEWSSKARGIALRVGAVDVELGRTLTNIPIVNVIAPEISHSAILPLGTARAEKPRKRSNRRAAFAIAAACALILAALAMLVAWPARQARRAAHERAAAETFAPVVALPPLEPRATTPAPVVLPEVEVPAPTTLIDALPSTTTALATPAVDTGVPVSRARRTRLPMTDYYIPAEPVMAPQSVQPVAPVVEPAPASAVDPEPPAPAPVASTPESEAPAPPSSPSE